MNKESIELRLAVVKQSLEQAIANLNVLIGQKNECEHWLEEISREDVICDKISSEII